jgi:prepilin-type N-terminal cleavage/methylation domain-containing protein
MRRRGLTLVEVMVSTSIFLGLSMLVVVIMRVGQRSEVKGDVHSQADRAVLVGLAKIQAEIQGGVVYHAIPSIDEQPGLLKYLYIDRSNTEDTIDFTGHPNYKGPAVITREKNRLIRLEERPGTGGQDMKPLVDLGSEGEVSFQMMSNRLLQISLSATRPDVTDNGRLVKYEQVLKVYVTNQP